MKGVRSLDELPPECWCLISDLDDAGYQWSLWRRLEPRHTQHAVLVQWDGVVVPDSDVRQNAFPARSDNVSRKHGYFIYYRVTPDLGRTILFTARHLHTREAWFRYCARLTQGDHP